MIVELLSNFSLNYPGVYFCLIYLFSFVGVIFLWIQLEKYLGYLKLNKNVGGILSITLSILSIGIFVFFSVFKIAEPYDELNKKLNEETNYEFSFKKNPDLFLIKTIKPTELGEVRLEREKFEKIKINCGELDGKECLIKIVENAKNLNKFFAKNNEGTLFVVNE